MKIHSGLELHILGLSVSFNSPVVLIFTSIKNLLLNCINYRPVPLNIKGPSTMVSHDDLVLWVTALIDSADFCIFTGEDIDDIFHSG